jgi:hypothetical protein
MVELYLHSPMRLHGIELYLLYIPVLLLLKVQVFVTNFPYGKETPANCPVCGIHNDVFSS